MPLVVDLLDRSYSMLDIRRNWEATWNQVCDLCLPFGPQFRQSGGTAYGYDALSAGPVSSIRGKYIYDSTPIWIVDRLTAGIESLATPAAQKWHGMKPVAIPSQEVPHEEKIWCEKFRDYMFEVRYNPKSGFVITNQKAIRNTVALGTAVFFVEEAWGTSRNSSAVPITYMPIPLSEACIGVDYQDTPDTLYRRYWRTARSVIERFGADKVSQKVRNMANDVKRKDELVEILHCVMPRDSGDTYKKLGKLGAQTASYYVEVDEKHLIGEGGYYEFPFAVYYWNQGEGQAYGESPMMYALADIKMLQLMNKHSIRAFGQWVDPPYAVAANGVTVNFNARAQNAGLLDANGNLRIKPIITQQRPDLAEQAIEKRREALKESSYLNLFQSLVERPEQTATEVLVRNNEKGDILGPVGAKIQAGHARMFDREFGILQRKGALDPGSPLAAPGSLSDREINIEFTSPFDRLRRSSELMGIQQTMQLIAPIAETKPQILDNIDEDELYLTVSEITGMPKRITKSREQVQQDREQRQQQEQQQLALQQAEQAGKAAKGIPALTQAPEAMRGIRDAMGQLSDAIPQGQA